MSQSLNDGAFVQVADNVYVDIDSGTSTNYFESALRFRHGSVTRFAIEKDNVANADLYIRRYNSSGVLQDSPIKIAGDTGNLTLTQTGTFTIQYDASNYVSIAVSSAGAVVMTAVGSSDSFEITNGDGNIILDAGADIDLDPAGNDINILGAAAGKITTAATSISIYGGDTTGDDLVLYGNSTDTTALSVLGTTGVTIAGTNTTGLQISNSSATALDLVLGATTAGITIDAGTTNHAGDESIIALNIDVEGNYSVDAIKVNLDFDTTGMAGTDSCSILTGDINEVVAHADNAVIYGTNLTITGFATGRCNLIGHEVTFDGSKTGGDVSIGYYVNGTNTVNHSGEIHAGTYVDFSGITLTDGTVYGNYVNATFTNGSTAYGIYVLKGADTTAAIGIDAGTTDTTAGSAIDIDFDVASASANCINLDIDVGTALSSAEIVRGIAIDFDGLGTDAADSEVTGLYINSAGTSTGIRRAIDIEGLYDNVLQMGISGGALVVTAATDHIIDCYATCGDTSGTSINFFNCDFTMTGIGGTGGRAYFNLNIEAALGGWSNALKGQASYAAGGSTSGMGSAVCAELQLSAGTSSGTYAALEAEIVAGSGCSTGTGTSYIYFNGTDASGLLNANCFLFELGAIHTSGATNLWYDHQGAAPGNIEEWIKVKTPSGTRWLALYDAVV